MKDRTHTAECALNDQPLRDAGWPCTCGPNDPRVRMLTERLTDALAHLEERDVAMALHEALIYSAFCEREVREGDRARVRRRSWLAHEIRLAVEKVCR